jgi:hypothetical protein
LNSLRPDPIELFCVGKQGLVSTLLDVGKDSFHRGIDGRIEGRLSIQDGTKLRFALTVRYDWDQQQA